ncbi:ABC transporter permease subunit [Pusillimonas sp. TS35]|uniref:ABC transporter permease n=1 Tax=Paracandidimonas lactea TaxID=2895524 RepID=UPI00136C40B8|nr:ABC transporter permease [Paracandidimonas lactea]MYN13352.1 ABC transporter permease subunit [Pusillimonas sp. TS35]
MLQYLIKRLTYAVILLLAVLTLNFLLIHISPGDPVETIAGAMGGMTDELRQELTQKFGLDKPFIVQLGIYLGKIAQGDLGQSYYFNASVASLIWERVPATLLLVVVSVLLAFFIGTLLGSLAARRPNGMLSQVVTMLSIVGYSAPVFWTGIVLIILFASVWPIFPVSDMRTAGMDDGGLAGVLDVLEHMVLPAFTLAFVYLAQYSRLARASMMEALSADYIRTARAKGLPESVVLYKHALRNAVLPVVTMLGMQFGNVLAGAILVETVFNWPGLGRLAFDSVLRRDYPTMLGILFFASMMVIVMNQLTDLAYRIIDPRIKTS